MKASIPACVLVTLVFGLAGQGKAEILTFDETPALSPWVGGLLADGFSIPGLTPTAGAATRMSGISPNTAFSGENALFNYNSREGRIVRSTPFDLAGAYFKWDDRYGFTSPTKFTATGYDASGTPLYSVTDLDLTGDWTFIALDMPGISIFGFDPTDPSVQNMQVDDLTYNVAIPEPASVFIWSLAIGVGLLGRRRRARLSN